MTGTDSLRSWDIIACQTLARDFAGTKTEIDKRIDPKEGKLVKMRGPVGGNVVVHQAYGRTAK